MADPMFASRGLCEPMPVPVTGHSRRDFARSDRSSTFQLAVGHFLPIRLKTVVSWRLRNAELAPRRRRSPSASVRARTVNPRKEDRR